MAHAITFDTLAFANKLKAVGIDPKHAEAQASAQAELFAALVEDKLATKEDLKNFATKDDIKKLEQDFKKLDSDIKNLELINKQHIEQLNEKMNQIESRMETKMDALENRLLIKLGGTMVVGVGLLATLLTIFHMH